MAPERAARLLIATLRGPPRPRTVADAAAESGLALRDADRGLHWLTREYRGHLRVTEGGDLLFVFPHGFEKPWQTRAALARAVAWLGCALAGATRFVVRAWLAVVLLVYAAVFLGVLLGLAFARSSDDDASPVGAIVGAIFRALADALFWAFHPFSPFALAGDFGPAARPAERKRRPRDETPFYEKINRFFFGPTVPAPDPLAPVRAVLAEARAQKGRIGLGDVMRVTGLPREEADPLMARLMLDYGGDVVVSEGGGITYRFPDLRRTAAEPGGPAPRPEPAWARPVRLPPLTGNGFGANAIVVALNAFNAVMAGVALSKGLTLANVNLLLRGVPADALPPGATPLVLGVVPLAFSLALLLIPLGRAIARPRRARALARENARLAVLREVLSRSTAREPLAESVLAAAWTRAAGSSPAPGELARVAASYGGDVDVEASGAAGGRVRYRFADLEAEAEALEAEREAAADAEARVGKVVFASDEPL